MTTNNRSMDIARLLSAHSLSFQPLAARRADRLFHGVDETVRVAFIDLWRKYSTELADLSRKLAAKYDDVIRGGFGAIFGDAEGELLYILIRETRPELVYEISPNSGYSTNYILSAVSKNGFGRVESFEIIDSFYGRPTPEVIKANLIEGLDLSRHNVNVGDARSTVPKRLARETPSFTLIDSCHEDWFAEFYLREVLPRVSGPIFIQDIAHFDPRPEWSSEAYLVLSFLEETGTRFIEVGAYEDALASVRSSLTPRRPIRSNSIIVSADNPMRGASALPTTRYRSVWDAAEIDSDDPGFIELLALYQSRTKPTPTPRLLSLLEGRFLNTDPFQQVMTLSIMENYGRQAAVHRLLPAIAPREILGSQLPLVLAHVAKNVGDIDGARFWLSRCRAAATDTSIATGYRELLQAVQIYLRLGDKTQATETFAEVISYVGRRGGNSGLKISKEIAAFCLAHPRYLFVALRCFGFAPFLRILVGSAFRGATLLPRAGLKRVLRLAGLRT